MNRGTLAMIFVLFLFVGGCGTASKPLSDATREEINDFRQSMQDSAKQANDYLNKTRAGTNISEFTIGWFVYDVLIELSSRDEVLYKHFNNNNKDLQDYLKSNFRDHPLEEITAIENLARQDQPTLRLSARYALEALRHIPNPAEAEEIQTRDRRELASALATLQNLLEKSAREVSYPPL
jgi:hypothetical protein